ncbi:hypothetical protein F2P81_008292 [Scophthalmus maximus]|uniref:Uncharacterized protein n=1 Tax=Scophthalmus maximus TaxID=52904 RepID=A0A6A4T1W1_SCOMX|nr:hypothetical protein F2P81_008292 [Scophthalmus maximus]
MTLPVTQQHIPTSGYDSSKSQNAGPDLCSFPVAPIFDAPDFVWIAASGQPGQSVTRGRSAETVDTAKLSVTQRSSGEQTLHDLRAARPHDSRASGAESPRRPTPLHFPGA